MCLPSCVGMREHAARKGQSSVRPPYFFSRAMLTAIGRTCSGTATRDVIEKMIEVESPSDPLSNLKVARRRMPRGLNGARRIVKQYRKYGGLLRLALVERRRRHA